MGVGLTASSWRKGKPVLKCRMAEHAFNLLSALSVTLNVPGVEISTGYVYRKVFVYIIFVSFIVSHSITASHLVIGNKNGLHDIQVRIFFLMFVCSCIVSIIRNWWPSRCNFWFIYLYPISSTCFGRCFRPSSGALDCIYSIWYSPPCCCQPVSWTRWNRSSISSMTSAGSNIDGLYQKL